MQTLVLEITPLLDAALTLIYSSKIQTCYLKILSKASFDMPRNDGCFNNELHYQLMLPTYDIP